MTHFRHLIWLAALLPLVALEPAIRASPSTTYGGVDGRLLGAELAVAALLVFAGILDSFGRRTGVSLVALLWLAPEAAGVLTAPDGARTLADAAARALPGATVAVVAVSTLPRSPVRRRLTLLALVASGVAAAARVLLVDPFVDLDCWRTCNPNAWALTELGLGRALTLAGLLLTAVAAVLLARELAAGRGRPECTAVGVAGVALVTALLAVEALRRVRPESATSPTYLTGFLVVQTAAAALGLAVALTWYRAWRLGLELSRLAAGLQSAPAPGTLALALGRAVGNPSLRIEYWSPERELYVDTDGAAAPTPPTTAQVTPVSRNDRPLARLVHALSVDGERLDNALGAALRLSLENEALRARTLADLRELQSSRRRIVERAADERRRLERNLHDGAQQRVVALLLVARMLRSSTNDPDELATVERVDTLTRAALEELRRVARGIYPAVLADAGLCGALLDLAEGSQDVEVSMLAAPAGRYQGTVETTAYLVAAAALDDARERGASRLTVAVTESGGRLRLDLRDDAVPAVTHRSHHLLDQVRALSGALEFRAADGRTAICLELPCAS